MVESVQSPPQELLKKLTFLEKDKSRKLEKAIGLLEATVTEILQKSGHPIADNLLATRPLEIEHAGEKYQLWFTEIASFGPGSDNIEKFLALKIRPQTPQWAEERFIFYITPIGEVFNDIEMEEQKPNIDNIEEIKKLVEISRYITLLTDSSQRNTT